MPNECDTAIRQLPLVLDGEPGSLARGPEGAKGLDGTIAYDWSPTSINRNNRMLTAGLRFNEPLPLPIHNTMSLGYVRNSLSSQFLPAGAPPWKSEQGVEFNALLDVYPCSFCSPWFSTTQTSEEAHTAQWFLDFGRRWISRLSVRVRCRG